jgi:hypothetical protein
MSKIPNKKTVNPILIERFRLKPKSSKAPKSNSHQRLKGAIKRYSDPKALGLSPLPPKRSDAKGEELRSLINGTGKVDAKTRKEMVDYAIDSGKPELKKAMLNKLPQGPNLSGEVDKVEKSFRKSVHKESLEAFRGGKKDSPLYKLGELFHAQTLGSKGGDFEGEVDQKKLGQKIQNLMRSDKKLQKEMTNIADVNLAKWRVKPESKKAIQDQLDFLKSDGFQQRLRLLPAKERDQATLKELKKLAILAPDKVIAEGKGVLGERVKTAQEYPLEGLANLKPKARMKVLTGVVTNALGGVALGANAVKAIADKLGSLPPSTSRSKILEMLRQDAPRGLDKALGVLGVISLGADIVDGKVPNDLKTALSEASTLTGTAGALAKPLTNLLHTHTFRNMSTTLRLVKGANTLSKVAPALGGTLGSMGDVHSAFESLSKGDDNKAAAYGAAAGLGGLALTVAAVSNPVGWGVGALGLAAGGTSFLAGWMDGKDEKLLRRLGLFNPAGVTAHGN